MKPKNHRLKPKNLTTTVKNLRTPTENLRMKGKYLSKISKYLRMKGKYLGMNTKNLGITSSNRKTTVCYPEKSVINFRINRTCRIQLERGHLARSRFECNEKRREKAADEFNLISLRSLPFLLRSNGRAGCPRSN